jgi:hypothetical protein
MYSPLRDAFRDMNKMMIDRQVWQAEHERRLENDAFNRQQADQQQQRQQMQDEITAVKVAEARQQLTPKPFSLYDIGDRDRIEQAMSMPGAAEQMEMAVGDGSFKWSPSDGMFKNERGDVANLSPVQARNRANAFYGIIDIHDDTPEQIAVNLTGLQEERQQLLADQKKYGRSEHTKALKTETDIKLSKINKEIKNHVDFLNPKTGKLLAYYTNKTKTMNKRARWAASIGANELANLFNGEAGKLHQASQQALAALMKPATKQGTIKERIWYAESDDSVNPKTGKKMKRNESYVERYDLASEVDAKHKPDGFSAAKVPDPKDDKETGASAGSRMTNDRAVYKVGEQIITQKTLPRNLILPNKAAEVEFWAAANKLYATRMKGVTGMDSGGATLEAHAAIKQAMETHNQFKEALDEYKAWKYNSKTKMHELRENGVVVDSLSPKDYNAEVAEVKADAKKELDYIPSWGFKFQN